MTEPAEFTGYRDAALLHKPHGPHGPVFAVHVRMCARCGSLVVDEDLHDVWHASQESPSP